GQRQFNIGAAMELTRMFGTPIAPAMSGDVLFGRVAGMMPLEARRAIADLTGVEPVTGQTTLAARRAIADLTGVDPVTGLPTFAARQAALRTSAGGLAGGSDRASIL